VEVRAVALRAIGHQRAGCPRPVDQAGALETVLAQEISLTGQRLAQARVVRAQALAPGPVLVRDPEPVQEELPVHDLVPADARRAAT
jgi:hypothetical protein